MNLRKINVLLFVLSIALAAALVWAAPTNLLQVISTYRLLDGGNEVPLNTHMGKAVFLVFWASWCVPCVEEVPNINSIYQRFRHEGLQVISLNVENLSDKKLKRIIQRLRIRYPVGRPSADLMRDFNVNAIPASYLYNRSGALVREWIGPPSAGELNNAVRQALSAAVPPPILPMTPVPRSKFGE